MSIQMIYIANIGNDLDLYKKMCKYLYDYIKSLDIYNPQSTLLQNILEKLNTLNGDINITQQHICEVLSHIAIITPISSSLLKTDSYKQLLILQKTLQSALLQCKNSGCTHNEKDIVQLVNNIKEIYILILNKLQEELDIIIHQANELISNQ